ncbi:DUF4258 domain-containing protein [Candidatus Woesearchaeota archaeon]|nr:DUF4258 domain-containing protein [Candidatus Woesearchaeota archaeon]
MIITAHARDEMEHSDLSEEEVEHCLRYGKLIIKQVVRGELRYGKELDAKDKKIVIIYAYENEEEKVITAYPIRRKKTWQN